MNKENEEKVTKNQINGVRNLLKRKKTITSWEAIQEFGATRLSAIIYLLRHNEGWKITTQKKMVKTRYGKVSQIGVYTLIEIPSKEKQMQMRKERLAHNKKLKENKKLFYKERIARLEKEIKETKEKLKKA